MNLMCGQIGGDGTRFVIENSHSLPLDDSKGRWANRSVTLGIRPEHIQVSPCEHDGLPLGVETLELLGADNLAHGRIGETPLVARLPHNERPQAGSTLRLHLPADGFTLLRFNKRKASGMSKQNWPYPSYRRPS
ncbi:sn-glycerol-3-phosphate import ATP-binding protein UgpC|nr:sn-glycerol-3-phosphate import ATP-binding protein UgpC [Candidatus Pantoea persica]